MRNGGFISQTLALSANISKFNAQSPNAITSSTASHWMQHESIDKLKKLCALNVGKRVRDKWLLPPGQMQEARCWWVEHVSEVGYKLELYWLGYRQLTCVATLLVPKKWLNN